MPPMEPAAIAAAAIPYPEKFELAKKFGDEGPLSDLSDSDKLLLYALSAQAAHGDV